MTSRWRAVLVAAVALLGVGALVAPSAAQTTTPPGTTAKPPARTTVPAKPTAAPRRTTVPRRTTTTAAPTTTVGVPATVPVPTSAPVSSAPTTTVPSPVGTIEGACAPFPAPDVVFVGTVVTKGDVVVTFRVTEVRSGDPGGQQVDVEFPDDARFLRVGSSYLVAASRDAESGRLSSKVRRPPGEEIDAACAATDHVVTKEPGGGNIDTSLLGGMKGKWGRALFLLLAPLGVAILVLLAVVIVKRLLLFGFRLPGRVRDARARRSPRVRDHRGHAGEPPPVSRR